jgi:signal transduction histidine kinase
MAFVQLARPRASGPTAWPARISAWLGQRAAPDAIDVALAVCCFAGFTLPVLLGTERHSSSWSAVAGFGVMAAAPLVVRRKWPAATCAAIAAVYVAATLTGVQFTPFVSNAGPNLAIAAFTVADRRAWKLSLLIALGAALATSGVLPLGFYMHPAQGEGDAVQAAAVVVGWVAGDAVRRRRTYRQRLELEARHREMERDGRVRAEERLRLSRDVHDVVSHSLSVIAVRSGVARLLLTQRPDEAETALAAIETASRTALDELRQLLRQIREPADDHEPLAPGIDDIPVLVHRMRYGGLDLTYRSTGKRHHYGVATEMAAYRIVQEALTNVVKHSGASSASVELSHTPAVLTISVIDDGPCPPSTGRTEAMPADVARSGFGIAGMRERADLMGGSLIAGPRPEGGYAVVATLPVKSART